MGTTKQGRRKKDPPRQFLGSAVSLFGIGVALLAISFALPASSPGLQAVGKGMRMSVPYVFFFGIVLLVLYAVVRPKAATASFPKNPSTLFGKDTTDFASQLDRSTEGAALPAQHRGQRPPATEWSVRVFDDIEWRRFEALCEGLFGQAGLLQCKHWQGKAVGVKEMREFYGVMASHRLQRGTFATSSTFTPEARKFAADNGISALDGQGLLALIATRTPDQQEALLATAYEGEYWRPTCASCGTKMAERTSRARKNAFWGCVNYPRCSFTLAVRT